MKGGILRWKVRLNREIACFLIRSTSDEDYSKNSTNEPGVRDLVYAA